MRKTKIILDFLRASNAELETQTGTILAAMTGNDYFTTPTPTLEEVEAARKLYVDSLFASQSRDKFHIEQRKEARKKLELQLTRLSNYVMVIAGDSRPIMVSSGFTVTAETSSATSMGEPENFAVSLGTNSGEAMLSINPVKDKKSYNFFWALADAEPLVWGQKPGTKPWFIVTGLEPLKTYLFKIQAVGNKEQTAETEIIRKIVL